LYSDHHGVVSGVRGRAVVRDSDGCGRMLVGWAVQSGAGVTAYEDVLGELNNSRLARAGSAEAQLFLPNQLRNSSQMASQYFNNLHG
jgi:hypothetical protein